MHLTQACLKKSWDYVKEKGEITNSKKKLTLRFVMVRKFIFIKNKEHVPAW